MHKNIGKIKSLLMDLMPLIDDIEGDDQGIEDGSDHYEDHLDESFEEGELHEKLEVDDDPLEEESDEDDNLLDKGKRKEMAVMMISKRLGKKK